MVLTEDHAPVFPAMLKGWRVAKLIEHDPLAGHTIEFIQWKNKIITRNGKHYVTAWQGEPYRTYGLCQSFGVGDYICRSIEDPTKTWVVEKDVFENGYTIYE